MLIKIDPVAKPRMTRSDVWNKRPAVMRYRAFCDELRLHIKELPDPLNIKFYIAMPESWSKKKSDAHRAQPHKHKPDIDNLCKAIMDAICEDDAHIWRLNATKIWDDRGMIEIY